MKNLRTVLTIAALVFVSGAVMATGNLKVNIVPGSGDKAVVHIENATDSKYEVELHSVNGEIVYYNETRTPSKTHSQAYDFSMIKDGEYVLEIKVDNEKELSTLSIKNGKVEVLNQQKEVEPFFTMKGDQLELSYLNFGSENVKLLVYDNNSRNVLYSKNLGDDFAINYGLDFSKLKNGKYDAVLLSANNSYEYEVAIK
ncbi:MAG TPA: hypothetical protein VJ919_10090 [Tangfeifania sp.]|nr:hypothetical protein [Tangfeifania sp.]